jgi:hypothetical protein
MTMPMENTWAERDLPILKSALRRLDSGESFPQLEDIRNEVGLSVVQMRLGIDALCGAYPPYMTVRINLTGPDRVGGFVESASERARRELGTWPSASSIVDDLVVALNQAADSEPRKDSSSKLRGAAQVLGDSAKQIFIEVIASKIGRY